MTIRQTRWIPSKSAAHTTLLSLSSFRRYTSAAYVTDELKKNLSRFRVVQANASATDASQALRARRKAEKVVAMATQFDFKGLKRRLKSKSNDLHQAATGTKQRFVSESRRRRVLVSVHPGAHAYHSRDSPKPSAACAHAALPCQ